jgi:1-acyl-sn-glycerol-3-phosphate acyltransferase
MSGLIALWRRFAYWFLTRVYFARITLLNPERRPRTGPVLYLGLHRNGAVDGFVYHQVLRGPTFMISTHLRRNWFARLFFAGIAVTRTKDEGERGANDSALRECVELLKRGGALFVFPEGTSSLGPRHLPFKSGAAWLVLQYMGSPGPPLQVIPVGIHYECPWAFRAKVEVVLGDPIDLTSLQGSVPDSQPTLAPLKALKRGAQSALEAVGINVPSAEYQQQIQKLAYISTLATTRSYFASLKALERQVPEPIRTEAQRVDSFLCGRRLLTHQGVPLVPMGPALLYVLAFLAFAPIVAAAVLINALPMLAGFYAGRKFPDDVNVISLWRILVGIPVFLLWLLAVSATLLLAGKPRWLVVYALVTWAGLQLYDRVKKLAVAVHNGLRHPNLRPEMLQFRELVLKHLAPDPAVGRGQS